MTRKTKIRLALVAALVILGCPCAFFGWWAAFTFGSDSGSPELAAEWREKLIAIDRLDAASNVRGAQVFRFANGEWAVGLAASSHGIFVRGGGTVVIRDSRGGVRAFFGHVCGGLPPSSDKQSLDEFYAYFSEIRREHFFD